ncbi:MAG: DUF7108 family protein [Halobacteriota archaeon]
MRDNANIDIDIDSDGDTDSDADGELPPDVIAEAERLSRLARNAVDPDESAVYRIERESTVTEYGYAARIRDADDTLVLYPDEWVEDGIVQFDRVEDTDRAVEVPLTPQGGDDYASVEAHNASIVAVVDESHGPPHTANVRAFADFMGNHYLQHLETATADQLAEFFDDYYRRNAWPSDRQREQVERSIELAFEAAGEPYPDRVDSRS